MYSIRRRLVSDPPQLSAWFRLDGWIIVPEAAALFRERQDAENAMNMLAQAEPGRNGTLYEYRVEEARR